MEMNPVELKIEKFFASFPSSILPKNKIVIAPGAQIKNIYYLKKGLVEQYLLTSAGQETTIHIFRPGSYFPIMLVLADRENKYYFKTVKDSLIYKSPREDVIAFIKKDSEILLDLTKRFALGLVGFLDRLESLTYKNVQSQIASILYYFAKHSGENTSGKITINTPITHNDIAKWVGVSRETVSRQMSKLKKMGLVSYGGKSITINDFQALKKMSLVSS